MANLKRITDDDWKISYIRQNCEEFMKNFIISILVGALSFVIGFYFGGSWLAGIPTGALGFMIAYFLLARKSMRKLEDITKEAMTIVQEGQESQNPEKMLANLESGVKIFEKGLDLSKEQFLMAEVIHAQMGALLYQGASLQLQLKMQEDMRHNKIGATRYESQAKKYFSESRYHLEKAHQKDWVLTLIRNWQGPGMLAVMEFREGKKKEALERMAKCRSVGKDDPLFWGAYTWMLHENDQQSDAMIAVNEGLSKNTAHVGLQKMADAIANKKSIDPIHFGMMWYSIFPEQLTVNVAMKLQSQMNDPNAQPTMNRQQRRMMKKKKYSV